MNCNKNPMPVVFSGKGLSDSSTFQGTQRSAAQFRWWMPAAFLTEAEVEREIRTTAEHGFRGLEICVNMADTHYSRAERALRGWGTPAWREMYRFILRTANRYGIQIDTTISPGWPAGIPGIEPADDCAAKEMNTYTYGPFTGRYSGPLPTEIDQALTNPNGMPATPPDGADVEPEPEPINKEVLQAVTVARIVKTNQVSMTGGRFGPPSSNPDGPKTAQYLLDPDSLQVLEPTLQPDGSCTVDFDGGDGQWLLFAFRMRGSCQTNRQGSATEKPCYAVDHFNRRGAQAVFDFWEKNILDDDLKAQLRENGGVIFEDSIELDIGDFATHWSPNQLELFRQHRGYDLRPYLPLLTGLTYMDPKPYKYELADENGEISIRGAQLRNDYCQFVTEAYYEEHIGPVQEWAASLGLGYRSQGYGLPFDLTAIAACSHGPEGESLGFGDGVRGDDRFRTISGGAHMAGRPIISDEMGAVAGEGYRWTWRSMLKWINKNMAGGANLIIFHGMPYAVSGSSKWPGYSPFGFGLAGQWGPRQPEWEHIDDLSDYLKRTQSILQCGRPRVDVAVLKVYYEGFNFSGLLPDQALMSHGYTYDFITPNTLKLDSSCADGRLAPEKAGYRAILLDNEWCLPLATVRTLKALADSGVRLIFCGRTPACSPFLSDEADSAAVLAETEALKQHPGAVCVATEAELPAALKGLGIEPALRLETPCDLMSIHRQEDSCDYYYLYYRGEPADISLSLEGTGAVYRMDQWSGKLCPEPAAAADGRMVLQQHLIPGQTILLAVDHNADPGVSENAVPQEMNQVCSLSDWTLSIERWERDDSSSDTTATRKTVLDLGTVPLKPWTELQGAGPEVSGIGTYRTALTLEHAPAHAVFSLPEIRCQSVQLTVNGQHIPVDHHTLSATLDGVLQQGENTFELLLITTLGNQLIAYGAFPSMPWMPVKEEPVPFGLTAPAILTMSE